MRIASTMPRTCKHCGALYLIIEYRAYASSRDMIACSLCDAELLRWNGVHVFAARLIAYGKTDPDDEQSAASCEFTAGKFIYYRSMYSNGSSLME